VRFGDDAGGAPAVAGWSEFRTPARAAEWTADVSVPLAQSGATGVVTFLVAVPVAVLVHLYTDGPLALAAIIPFLAGVFALALTWGALLSDHQKSLWRTETFESTPAPAAAPTPQAAAALPKIGVKLEVSEDNGRSMKFAHLPVDPDRLRTLARALLDGKRPFTVGEWTGAGKLMTRNEFEHLRTWMMESGFVRWIDDAARARGTEFTPGGRALLRALKET